MSKCDFCGHLALNGKLVHGTDTGFEEYRGPYGPACRRTCRNCAKATLLGDDEAWTEMDRRILAAQ